MLMSLPLPGFGTDSAVVRISTIHATAGTFLNAGSPLLDVEVDFSGGVSYNCAPVSYFRIIMRDQGWLRHLMVGLDEEVAANALLAVIGSEPDEAIDAAPAREARVTLMSILPTDNWWDDPT